jgi:hypothetical protein
MWDDLKIVLTVLLFLSGIGFINATIFLAVTEVDNRQESKMAEKGYEWVPMVPGHYERKKGN